MDAGAGGTLASDAQPPQETPGHGMVRGRKQYQPEMTIGVTSPMVLEPAYFASVCLGRKLTLRCWHAVCSTMVDGRKILLRLL